VPCHVPNVDGQIDLSLMVVLIRFCCMLCGQYIVAIILICDICSKGWHMGCLMPPLEKVLIKKWFCPWCT
jgi:hypothetical protein